MTDSSEIERDEIGTKNELRPQHFNFYGVSTKVVCSPGASPTQALDSFRFFRSEGQSSTDVTIYVRNEHFENSHGPFLFRFRNASAFGFNDRFVTYSEGERTFSFNRRNKKIEITLYDSKEELLDDILYSIINSVIGWELEVRGWVRLHSFSHLSISGCVAYLGDSGSGKSGLAIKHLKQQASIYSDEITLISPEGLVHSWPIPIQADQKLIDIFKLMETSREFVKRNYRPKRQVAIPDDNLAAPAGLFLLNSAHSFLGTALRITFGLGLPQTLELQLRLNNLIPMIGILCRRLRFFTRLWSTGSLKCRVNFFKVLDNENKY